MAGIKKDDDTTGDFYKPMSTQDSSRWMTGNYQQSRPMEKNDPSPNRRRNQKQKMGTVGAYIAETSRRCKPNGS
jgi:hypothetical protein